MSMLMGIDRVIKQHGTLSPALRLELSFGKPGLLPAFDGTKGNETAAKER